MKEGPGNIRILFLFSSHRKFRRISCETKSPDHSRAHSPGYKVLRTGGMNRYLYGYRNDRIEAKNNRTVNPGFELL